MNTKKMCGMLCGVEDSSKNLSLGLLLIRLSLAATFIFHGWMKVSDMDATIGMFASMGIGPLLTYAAAYTELLGGIAMLLGIATRFAGMMLSIVMVVAIAVVHFKNGFNAMNGGYEYALLLLVSVIAIGLIGPGKYSLHNKWCKGK